MSASGSLYRDDRRRVLEGLRWKCELGGAGGRIVPLLLVWMIRREEVVFDDVVVVDVGDLLVGRGES